MRRTRVGMAIAILLLVLAWQLAPRPPEPAAVQTPAPMPTASTAPTAPTAPAAPAAPPEAPPPAAPVAEPNRSPPERPAPPPEEKLPVAPPPPWNLAWNDAVHADLRPPLFEKHVRAAMGACDPEGLQLVAVDCTEPPCYAVFRAKRDTNGRPSDNVVLQEFASACDAWRLPFEDAVTRLTRHSGSFRCPDGSEEWILLFGSELALDPLGVTTEEREELTQDRGEDRREAWRRKWRCS